MKKIFALILALLMIAGSVMSLSAAEGEYTDKDKWVLSGESHQNSLGKLVDGDIKTYWHSYYEAEGSTITVKQEHPFRIKVEFPDKRDISGFCYTPRQDMQVGRVHGYNIYLAESKTGKFHLVKTGYIAIGHTTEYVGEFDRAYKAEAAVFEIFASEADYGCVAELGFLKGSGGIAPSGEIMKEIESSNVSLEKKFETVDTSKVTVSVSSIVADNFYKAENTIDGNKNTYWHSYAGSDRAGNNLPPFTIEYTFPASADIAGVVYTPRQDMGVGRALKYNIYATSGDNDNYTLLYSGKGNDSSADVVSEFTSNVTVKKVKFEIVESVSDYGTCAEMAFIKADGSLGTVAAESYKAAMAPETKEDDEVKGADKSKWTIEGSGDDSLKRLIDGDRNSYWHSSYIAEGSTVVSRDEAPFRLTFTFPVVRSISTVIYTPRQDLGTGRFESFNIYIADSDSKTPVLVKSGTVDPNLPTDLGIELGNTYLAKKVVIEVTKSVNGFCTAGEIDFVAGTNGIAPAGEAMKELERSTENTYFGNVNIIPQKNWKAVASNAKGEQQLDKALDGNKLSYWHSDYTNEGSTITSRVAPPHEMLFTANEAVALSGFIMTPRQDSVSGRPTLYDVYVSSDDNGEFYHIGEYTGDKTEKDMFVTFNANVITKRIKVVIKETPADYGMMAEVNFMAAAEGLKTINASEYDANRVYKIENIVIENTAGEQLKKLTDGLFTTSYTGKKEDTIRITLPAETEISAISVYPFRHYGFSGLWTDFDVLVSTDGENFDVALSRGSLEKELKEQMVSLPAPVKAKYIEISVYNGIDGSVSASEISVFRSKAGQDTYLTEGNEKYVLAIDNKEIQVEKGNNTYTVTSDVAPFIKSDITFIPLRVLLEQMGASIAWDGEKQEIKITKEDAGGKVSITMRIWDDRVFVSDGDPNKYDTVRYTLIAPPRIYDGRTFIPLRFVSENLGYNVGWNGETRTITVTKTVK